MKVRFTWFIWHIAELEDDGMPELLLLRDKIAGLITGTDDGAAKTGETVERADIQRDKEKQKMQFMEN